MADVVTCIPKEAVTGALDIHYEDNECLIF